MDNSAGPIPSTLPAASVQSEVSTPVKTLSRRWLLWLLWLAGGLAVLTLGIAIGVFGAKFISQSTTQSQISSYEDCLAAKGSIVQYSYPATCVTASGQRFVQPLTDEEKQGLQPPDLYREPTSSAATSDWKTYNNDFYNLRFLYSPTDIVEENQTGGGFQIIINKGKDSEISVGISPRSIGQLDTFLDTPSRGKTTIGENTWLEFFLPQGYQDAGDTNIKPVYAIKITKGGFIYTARIFGSSPTKEQNQILSTFQFDK